MKNKRYLAATLLALASVVVAACGPIAGIPGEKTIYVGPYQVDCVGVAPQKCLLVKEKPGDDWTLFYDQIEGFEYEPGFEYELRIVEERVENPPADASSIRRTLVEVVSKTRSLEGTTWVMESYANSDGVLAGALPGSEATARFQDGQVNGNASCNSYFGTFRFHGDNKVSVDIGGMTEMYCAPEELMEQEREFLANLDKAASYLIAGDKLQIEDVSGDEILVFSAQEATPLVGTLWQLSGYNNGKGGFSSVLRGSEITASFGEDGNISGSAGCNNYATNYEISGEQIRIGPVASTMMACPEPEGIMEQEQVYLGALEKARTYQIEGRQLSLFDQEGQVILAYTASEPTPLMGTQWGLTGYNNGRGGFSSVIGGTEITATFNDDGMVTGSAGCNNYNGAFEAEDARSPGGPISIGPVASTMMACPAPEGVMEQETAYLSALQSATAYEIQGDELTLTGAEGQRLATYTVSEGTPLIGTLWEAIRYNNGKEAVVSLVIGTEVTAIFGEDGSLSGSAGCNNYMTSYQVEGDSISIGPAATTRKFCAEPEGTMEQENLYLAALEQAATYRIDGDRLELRDGGGALQASYVARDEAAAGAEGGGLDEESLKNMEYMSEWTQSGTAPLTDGEYREQAAPGSATETVVQITPYVAYGQLDGQQAAAVILVTDPGGSGTFYDLAVVVEQGGQPVNIATTSLGDRVQVNSLAIAGNEIVVDMITQGPEDPMCCPTQNVVKTYALQGDQLVETSSQVRGSSGGKLYLSLRMDAGIMSFTQ